VNIIYADTKNIDGKAFGQIVIQVPRQKTLRENMMHYLQRRGLTVEEVNGYVG
jgi:D-methionine transport system ATP-binding protein